MRIGIVPSLYPGMGIYQYSVTMLNTLHEWQGSKVCGHEFVVFTDEGYDPTAEWLKKKGWEIRSLTPPSPMRQASEMLGRLIPKRLNTRTARWIKDRQPNYKVNMPDPDEIQLKPRISQWIHRSGVELMVYPQTTPVSFETGIPYVMAVHDIQHRLQPEFPEVSANGEWERREYRFRNGARYATLLLADSEVGKEDILNFYGPYGVTPDRVKVLPFIPATSMATSVSKSNRESVRTLYGLPQRYLFFPAQFWPHKNHVRVVEALGLLREKHALRIPVVFCGSNAGELRKKTFEEVMSLSRRLGVKEEIHYLGYVPDEHMAGLYAEAAALVFPTFFGPTNIPVLEAWAFGCPVLTSDIRGIREQVGDAAIRADPRSTEDIAHAIHQLWTDEGLCFTLADRGRQRLSTYTSDDYRQRLIEILDEAVMRVETGGNRSPNLLD
jgi:glycosyltransferase involved in cell wall biosynthesis